MICISSGHGKYVRGALGFIDEVEEARRVVERVAKMMSDVEIFHDDTSKSQGENLDTIVAWHNSQSRDLDVSIHFNAYQQTDDPMGVEVLFLTQDELALEVCEAIADEGLTFRGPKFRDDLAFLNGTDEPAILIEVCFVDSSADVEIYRKNFDAICQSIADTLEDWGSGEAG